MSALPREKPPGEPQTSPVTGRVTHWHVTAGEQVDRYDALATIDDAGLEILITATTSGTVSATAPRGTRLSAGQPVAYIVPTAASQRRSNSISLTLVQPAQDATQPVPRPRPRSSKQRIIKHTSHITDAQQEQLRELVSHLQQLGGNYAQAELERLAFALLLGLDEGELVQRLEQQRDIEEQERYGFGNRPR